MAGDPKKADAFKRFTLLDLARLCKTLRDGEACEIAGDHYMGTYDPRAKNEVEAKNGACAIVAMRSPAFAAPEPL